MKIQIPTIQFFVRETGGGGKKQKSKSGCGSTVLVMVWIDHGILQVPPIGTKYRHNHPQSPFCCVSLILRHEDDWSTTVTYVEKSIWKKKKRGGRERINSWASTHLAAGPLQRIRKCKKKMYSRVDEETKGVSIVMVFKHRYQTVSVAMAYGNLEMLHYD